MEETLFTEDYKRKIQMIISMIKPTKDILINTVIQSIIIKNYMCLTIVTGKQMNKIHSTPTIGFRTEDV